MIFIRKITLTQFRNYSSAAFDFPSRLTCVTGPNGSGKTNLLDAVYYLCYTKSYFTSFQQHTAQKGSDGFRVEGIFDKYDRTDHVVCKWQQGRKEVLFNGAVCEHLSEHIGRYAAVMIAPDDTELINGGSELRRKWLDSVLGQTDKKYLECLMQYQRILLQRNAWLKQYALNPQADDTQLAYYNGQLSSCGAYIYEQRVLFVDRFVPLLKHYYKLLSSDREYVDIVYESDLHKGGFLDIIKQSLQIDFRYQRTTKGIHRDDFCFFINGHSSLKQFGSQGQKKSFLFALKLAQYSFLSKTLGYNPVLLLDDVFEKLDQFRLEALVNIIHEAGYGQVILTDTHPERISDILKGHGETGMLRL